MTGYLTDRDLATEALREEAAEVTIELAKRARFGGDCVNPYAGTTPNERLARELGDLQGSIDFFLETHPEINKAVVAKYRADRKPKLIFMNNPENWNRSYATGETIDPNWKPGRSYYRRRPDLIERDYAVLRGALRNAILRRAGTKVPDPALYFRRIEGGQSAADATDALESLLRGVASLSAEKRVS